AGAQPTVSVTSVWWVKWPIAVVRPRWGDTQRLLVDQARAARDAVSGVNLDEEAAQMLRFQQADQAAAQVIATADGLFQTLLDALRR
ncbi:MAG: flagellar basal body rod C-terminal domain-containing protein, partial [Pseudomonadota bacterium]|nr:flagellar basal body rod C-terminal domain-containing protein [Pseudomonadota bacterium]